MSLSRQLNHVISYAICNYNFLAVSMTFSTNSSPSNGHHESRENLHPYNIPRIQVISESWKNCFPIFPDYVELFLPLCKHISSSATFSKFLRISRQVDREGTCDSEASPRYHQSLRQLCYNLQQAAYQQQLTTVTLRTNSVWQPRWPTRYGDWKFWGQHAFSLVSWVRPILKPQPSFRQYWINCAVCNLEFDHEHHTNCQDWSDWAWTQIQIARFC